MAERVVLHIGTMKSGTSYLQSVLVRNLAALDAAGCHFLGGAFATQTRAVRDVVRGGPGQQWAKLAQEARRGTAQASLVSMEFLSFAREPALDSLLGPLNGLAVDVVVTVRDQFRAIPAQWQTYARNNGTSSWADYLHEIGAYRVAGKLPHRSSSRAFRTFHRAQDVPAILDRWSSHPGVRSVTVVTVPPPDAAREVLWDRFALAAGIEADVAFDGLRENISLGYASCDFLCRLNRRLGDALQPRYSRVLRPIAREVLLPLRGTEGRPELDRGAARYARSRNEHFRTTLQAASLPIVGSLEDLPVREAPAGRRGPVPPPDEDKVRRAAWAVRQHLLEEPGTGPGPAAEQAAGPAAGSGAPADDIVDDVAQLLRRRLARSR